MHSLLAPIADQIAQGELDQAIQKLRQLVALGDAAQFREEVLVLASRHGKLRSDTRKGILAYADQQLEHARITNALTEILAELDQLPDALAQYQKTVGALEYAQQARKLDFPVHLRETLYNRLAEIREKGLQARILWIDNHPSNNTLETEVLQKVGLQVDGATSSAQAEQLMLRHPYQVILSDISREGNRTEGIDFLARRRSAGPHPPFVFYTGHHEPAKGTPPYAFGITHSPEELLHLVMDVLARWGGPAREEGSSDWQNATRIPPR
ncbi:MAG: response regulator [Lewinella sp.]|nr:response regulator [Lewinella sp.]